jgi:hypothetical protein
MFIKGLENAPRKATGIMQKSTTYVHGITRFVTIPARAFNHPNDHRTEKLSITKKTAKTPHLNQTHRKKGVPPISYSQSRRDE